MRAILPTLRRWPIAAVVAFSFISPRVVAAQTPVAADERPATQSPGDRTKGDDDEADAGALPTEEALGRYQQLLERRPLHTQAFNGLVKHYAEQGKLADLVAQYEEKVTALPNDWPAKVVLARLYARAAQAEKAADLLVQIEAAPDKLGRDESKWLVFKAEVFQKTNRVEDAQKVLDQALAKAKTVSERLRLAEAIADLQLAAGNKDKAAAALTSLATEYRDNYLHRKRIADALAQRDLHEAALAQLRELLPLAGDKSDQRCEVLRQLGRSLEKLSKTQEGIDAYGEAVNLLAGGHWLQQELHERIVALYRQTGRLDDLTKYCRDQLQRRPEQTGVRVLLADVLAASGDTVGARKTLEDAVQLFPKDRTLSDRRVQLLERLNDQPAAAAEYERIIAQTPDDVELYVAYGQFLANNKQLDAARNQWKHVLNGDLADATLAHRLGSLFEPYELLDDAVECYERAITLSPARTESYAALARLWFVRGEREKTIASLRRMTAAAPTDAANYAAVAQVAGGLGLTDDALASITKACELQPGSAEYQSTRADLLVQAGRLDEAFVVRRNTLALITAAGQQAQAINVLVSMHASAGKLDALQAAETRRVEQNSKDVIALLLLARAADFERDFVSARNWIAKLLEVDPGSEEGRHQFARLLEATGDVDGAVDAYRKLIDMHPARARQWYQAIADLRLRYADKAGAIETFTRIVQTSPGNATVLKDVAEQLAKMGELEKSLEYYEQSLRIQADRHEIRLAYANTLTDAGRLDDAMAAYKSVAMQHADRDSASEAMGKLHDVAGRLGALDDLIDSLQTQVENDPENSLVAHALAELLIQEYEYSRAMDLIDTVLRTQPRDAELRLVRGELLRRLTKFDEALDEYRRILRFPNVDRDFVLGEMGKTCFEAGRVDSARTHWRQVSHKLYAGTLLRNNGLITDAIEILREGIRLKPDDYALHRNLIKALHAAGKVDEALDAARKLLDLEPDNVLNIRELAKAYLERGNRQAGAEIAGRLFSAAVMEKRIPGRGGSGGAAASLAGGPSLYAMSMQSAWSAYGWGGGQAPRSNLDSAVQFFQENGLLGELQDILKQQIEQQPENAMLKETSAGLFNQFGKPEIALKLLRELETATFPVEQQGWLGTSSQRDYYRLRQYQLIAVKPALRDARLAELETRGADKLARDELIELAVVRQAQGLNEKAIDALKRAVAGDARDVVALSSLVNLLMVAERYADAEPHVKILTEIVSAEREKLETELVERVRRDFVRSLPLPLQLRVTEDLLQEIARKWTLGQSFAGAYVGGASTIGYFRARMIQATICAKTDRMDEARRIWQELTPKHEADADGYTTLASVVQLHDQGDLALQFYEKAMVASRKLRDDPLLQRIYGGNAMQSWWGNDREVIDSTFNQIVGAFAKAEKLIELYDFLRDTGQLLKAKRVAQQYELYGKLKKLYSERVEQARATYRAATESPLTRSVPYFATVCKLAELHDQTGDWPPAQKVYEEYLADFPDELPLLITLGEVAETQDEHEAALEWEQKHIAAKERLAKRAREWALREHALTPAKPQILGGGEEQDWEWQQRWGGGNNWYWGNRNQPLEIWPSWIRIAQLYLALDNPLGAASALERAIGAAGNDRDEVAKEILALIQERQLGPKMLSVLRSLAVYLPTDQPVQLAFADSLEANDKRDAALEVYKRMLRRGVSDVGTLAQVKQKMSALAPEAAKAESDVDALQALEADVAADPNDAGNRLRLARAYYYSLEIDKALAEALKVFESAPHLEGLHDLLIEIYTVKGDSDKLVEALRTKIARISDQNAQNTARRRLADELLSVGKTDDALVVLKELADPKDPRSYERVGLLLHYFGKHDEAIQQFELASKSQNASMWQGDRGSLFQVRSRVIKGDIAGAAKKLIDAVDQQQNQQVQYGGMAAMYSFGGMQQSPFGQFIPLFALEPALTEDVQQKLVKEHASDPDDPQAAKTLFQFYRAVGMPEQAEQLLASLADRDIADQSLITDLIDQAIEKRQYDRAITMAEKFIEEQPKPVLPPGVPPQMAGMLNTMTPRNVMLCKLGDVNWKRGDKEKAFAAYKQVLDEKIDESRMAYAGICMMRDRIDDARKLVEDALSGQEVKSPGLLQFRAMLAALGNEPQKLFDDLARATEIGGGVGNNMFGGESADNPGLLARVATETQLIDRFAEFMNKRIEKNPNDWENYRLLAHTLRETGRSNDASAVIERAAAVKSVKQEALNQRIQWLEGLAKPDELIPLYEEAVTLAEKQTSGAGSTGSGGRGRFNPYGYGGGRESGGGAEALRSRLGDLYWELGQREKAETVWTGRLDPKSAATHIQMAQRMMERPEYEKAAASYRKALEFQPTNPQAHRALAELEFYAGNVEAALPHIRELFLRQYASIIDDGQDNRNQPRYYQPFRNDDEQQDEPDARGTGWTTIRTIAADLARDPKITARLAAATTEEDRDSRLALATIVGDWPAVESELSGRLAGHPFEPMVWRLWARCKERHGEWAEAVGAWDKVRRLKQTTLSRRRDQLKLALAGKQVKEAAAGLKDEQDPASGNPAAAAIRMRSYRNYGYDDSEGQSGEEVQRLIGLYLKLGDFQKAEQLRLVGQSANLSRALPELSSVMWRRGAKERALELSRLALTLSDDVNSAPQYAALLSESGQGDAAADLLIRTYRCQAQDENYGGYYGMMMGGGGGPSAPQLESGGEQQYASALYELCKKRGSLDETLKRLRDMWTQTPDDSRLGKLTLGLLTRDRRWDEAKATLETLRQKKPTDLPLLATLMRVQFQMHDWDAAGRSLDEIRTLAPESTEQWRTVDAFVKLMRGDRPGAIAAVAPLLEDLPASGRALPAGQAVTILGAPDGFDRLADYFERRRSQGDFTADAGLLLTRLYQLTGKWDKAAAIALDEIWNNQSVLAAGHPAFDALGGTLAAASAAKFDLAASARRPEDRALILMLTSGPKAGVDAFRSAVAENPENLNARRGLVLAAELAADWKVASDACDATVTWLAPHRPDLWRKATPRSLQRLAHSQMQSMKSSGVNTSMILGMSTAVGQLFEQALDQDGHPGEDSRQPLKYEVLWRAYQAYAPRLAMLAGNVDGAFAHLGKNATHARRVTHDESGGGRRNLRRVYYPGGGMATYWDSDENRSRTQSEFEQDSSKAMRRLLLETRQFSRLQAEFDKLGPHIPYAEWRSLAQAYAAVGRVDDARRWRQKTADAEVFDLRASDEAKLDTLSQWGWYYWYAGDNQDDQRLRSVLRTTARLPALVEMSLENARANDIATVAVDEAAIRTEFRRLVSGVPDGFGDSAVVSKLAAHFLASDDPRAIIELLERTIGADGLLRSERAYPYMQACLEAKDYDRAGKLVDAVAARSASLSDDVSLARLALLRLRGKNAEGDALENELLTKCRVQPKLASRVDDRILSGGFVDSLSLGTFERRTNRYRQTMYLQSAMLRTQTISTTADALGVQYDADVADHDITRARIADLYASHGLYEHAIRMNNDAVQTASDALSPAERAELLFENAEWLALAGRTDDARRLAAELETGWLQAAQAEPADSGPLTRLLRLYTSKSISPDHAKALEMSARLRKIRPNPTVSDPGEAASLFELNKPSEAWQRYQEISARGAPMTPGMLLRAGLSAARSGKTNEASEFLRQGLWLSPRHSLAIAAREIIHE